MPKSAFDINTCARPNILALEAYRCARDDYKDNGTNCLLDANENAYGPGLSLDASGRLPNGFQSPNGHANGHKSNDISNAGATELNLKGLNRYPDPHQEELKDLLCQLRHDPTTYPPNAPPLTHKNLFVGNGSDEAIDILLRCFCAPAKDKILICPPTYGMYTVSARGHDIETVKVPLQAASNLSIDLEGILKVLDEDIAASTRDPNRGRIKLVFLCSPGNPTGALIPHSAATTLLEHPKYNGLVVVDEAYIDFAPPGTSLACLTTSHPNLCVMQTLSKAFGLAGLRLGAAFTSEPVAAVMNKVKAPYNVSSLTSQLACLALQSGHLKVMTAHVKMIVEQRQRLIVELPKISGVGQFKGGFNANFVLVQVLDRPQGKPDSDVAFRIYEKLAAELGVVVRFRGKEHGCEGCLRITVGTEQEVSRLLDSLAGALNKIYATRLDGTNGVHDAKEEEREQEESDVVS